MKLSGLCSKGRIAWDIPEAWPIAMREYDGKRVVVAIERETHARTEKQNRRYFGGIVTLWIECMRQTRGLQMSKDQVHDMLCRAFIGTIDTPFGPVRKESKVLTTAEFAHFCDQCELALEEQWPGFDRRSIAEAYA